MRGTFGMPKACLIQNILCARRFYRQVCQLPESSYLAQSCKVLPYLVNDVPVPAPDSMQRGCSLSHGETYPVNIEDQIVVLTRSIPPDSSLLLVSLAKGKTAWYPRPTYVLYYYTVVLGCLSAGSTCGAGNGTGATGSGGNPSLGGRNLATAYSHLQLGILVDHLGQVQHERIPLLLRD